MIGVKRGCRAAAVVTVHMPGTGKPPRELTFTGEEEHVASPGGVPELNYTVPA
jgi:hypothetical protein